MKVVRVDNLNREGPGYDDVLIEENLTADEAKAIADELNIGCGDSSTYYHRVVTDYYKLQVFEP